MVAGGIRKILVAALGPIGILSLLLLVAPPAFAANSWVSEGPFGTVEQPSFEQAAGLAFDPATHDLLVIDLDSRTLSRFHEDGSPADFSALGTNVINGHAGAPDETPQGEILSTESSGESLNAAKEVEVAVAPPGSAGGTEGDIYVTDGFNHFVDVFAPTGEYLGQEGFGFPCGLATAPNGDLIVGSFEGPEGVYRLTPTAPADFTASTGSPFPVPQTCQVAAGAGPTAGSVFAVGFSQSEITKVESEGAQEGTSAYTFGREAGQTSFVAVDGADGHVFGASGVEGGTVTEYEAGSSAASVLSHFSLGGLGRGIAVNPSSGKVYVTEEGDHTVEVFAPVIGPGATTEAATGVAGSEATLHGQVNAEGGSETSCAFEYVSLAQFEWTEFEEASSVPCSPAGPFSGSAPHQVQAQLGGLHPGTNYRFRLVATNTDSARAEGATLSFRMPNAPYPPSEEFAPCPNQLFRTGFGALLPDCRAYEQASPADKNGGGAEALPNVVRAAADGEGVTFFSQAGVPGGSGAQEFPTFLASRAAGSWATAGLLPPATIGRWAGVLGYSSDLRLAFTQAAEPGLGTGLFMEETATHTITPIVPYFGAPMQEPEFALDGVSADGGEVFFESILPLTGQTPAGQQNLYAWNRSSGQVTLADVLPGGAPPAAGGFAGAYDWINEVLGRGGAFNRMYVAEAGAFAADGESVYFTESGTGRLFVRSGLTGGEPTTAQVNESHKTNGSGPGGSDPNGPKPAIFLEGSEDGSRALFMSSEELTNDANTGTADQGMDLYRYETIGGHSRLVDLAPDPTDPDGAEVQGVLGASRDESVVYFAANGVLAPGATPGDCENHPLGGTQPARRCNLYRYDDSSGTPSLTFITRLNSQGGLSIPSGDATDWTPASGNPNLQGNELTEKTARVDADGDVLLFASVDSLTGYENLKPGQGKVNDETCGETLGSKAFPCQELYRYSSATGQLTCVSCDPTGEAPAGPALLSSGIVHAYVGDLDQKIKSAVQTRALSADGDQVFFQTVDALVPKDTDGVSDVYEWEAAGAGSCPATKGEAGCLYLLSSGQGPEPSYFADASADGSSAFIFTQSQLVPADRDQAVDVYDAREGGGLASQNETAASTCAGSTCQGPSTAAPPIGSPGSSTLQGPGNPSAKKAGGGSHHKKHKKKKPHKKHRAKHRQSGKRAGRKQTTGGNTKGGKK
jgi:hypothetical protein